MGRTTSLETSFYGQQRTTGALKRLKACNLPFRGQRHQVIHLASKQDHVHFTEGADHSLQVTAGSHPAAVVTKYKDHAQLRVIQKTCGERDKQR